MHLSFIVLLGWLLSFLGQLPLGTMSMTATQVAVQENFRNAWKYSLGVTIIEMVYLRVVLSGVDWIMQHRFFFAALGWLTVVLFLLLGILSFISAGKQQADKKALLLNNNINRFWLGISMSTLNPAQIPFWFIWSSYFLDIKLLHTGNTEFNFFTTGAGLGTLAGLAVYIYGGNFLITKMKTSNKTLNKVMGVIFVIAALAQLYRMLYKELIK
jgi:threonine/homoserine/homoserine lactone efflux protein